MSYVIILPMDVYHILNRGVDKRDIVINDDDRMRFVRSLYVFNDINSAPNSVSQPKQWQLSKSRECLVRIHAWCLMNNHYHLIISPLNDELKNISKFMKKLNMGYAKYFNEKYERSGYLWQGKYKKILASSNSQFEYIPYYVHLNPLDYTHSRWRSGAIKKDTVKTALQTLTKYRWSSYLDYNNVKNFPSIIYTNLFNDVFKSIAFQNRQIEKIISGNNVIDSNLVINLEK